MGTQSKTRGSSDTFSTQNVDTTNKLTAQGWGPGVISGQLPVLQNVQGTAAKQYQTAGFTPQMQQSWANTLYNMQAQGATGPYGQYGQQYMQPVLAGGWQQYTDPATQETQRQYLMDALPAERQLFSEQAAKQLGPYRSGGEAAAFGSQYGQLLLDQASRQQALEGQIGQQNVAAKQLYGQQAPALSQQYAATQDPSTWGKTLLQMEGMPTDYQQQQQAANMAQLLPISQMLQGYGQMAYQYPESTRTTGTTQGYQGTDTVQKNASAGMQCCFIFLEGKMLTDPVRRLRDQIYTGPSYNIPSDAYVSIGYKKMATWLVPMMRRNSFVKKLVIETMLKPIATFSKYYEQKPKGGVAILLAPIGIFWAKVWSIYGKYTTRNR